MTERTPEEQQSDQHSERIAEPDDRDTAELEPNEREQPEPTAEPGRDHTEE